MLTSICISLILVLFIDQIWGSGNYIKLLILYTTKFILKYSEKILEKISSLPLEKVEVKPKHNLIHTSRGIVFVPKDSDLELSMNNNIYKLNGKAISIYPGQILNICPNDFGSIDREDNVFEIFNDDNEDKRFIGKQIIKWD